MGDQPGGETGGRDVLDGGFVEPDGVGNRAGDAARVVGRPVGAAVGDDDRAGQAPPLNLDPEQRPPQPSLLAQIVGEDRQLRERGAEAAAHWRPPTGVGSSRCRVTNSELISRNAVLRRRWTAYFDTPSWRPRSCRGTSL